MEAGGGWWAVGYETMMTRIYILILIYVWYVFVCVRWCVPLCIKDKQLAVCAIVRWFHLQSSTFYHFAKDRARMPSP